MDFKKCFLFAALLALTGSLNAQLLSLEDFESYADTASLQANVFSFGSAAQAGKPVLSLDYGVNQSKAARFTLTWGTGNNANLGFPNLPTGASDLSVYDKVGTTLFLATANGYSAPTTPTVAKLVIKGGSNNTVWQTRTAKAVQISNGASNQLIFELNETEMLRVAGWESFDDVLSNIVNIRLRFENTQQAGVMENAYIDSIVATAEPQESGTIIQISSL